MCPKSAEVVADCAAQSVLGDAANYEDVARAGHDVRRASSSGPTRVPHRSVPLQRRGQDSSKATLSSLRVGDVSRLATAESDFRESGVVGAQPPDGVSQRVGRQRVQLSAEAMLRGEGPYLPKRRIRDRQPGDGGMRQPMRGESGERRCGFERTAVAGDRKRRDGRNARRVVIAVAPVWPSRPHVATLARCHSECGRAKPRTVGHRY